MLNLNFTHKSNKIEFQNLTYKFWSSILMKLKLKYFTILTFLFNVFLKK